MSHRHHADDVGLKRLGIAVAINLLLTVAQVIGGVLAGRIPLRAVAAIAARGSGGHAAEADQGAGPVVRCIAPGWGVS